MSFQQGVPLLPAETTSVGLSPPHHLVLCVQRLAYEANLFSNLFLEP